MPKPNVEAPRWPIRLILAMWIVWLLFVIWMSRADWGRPKATDAKRPRTAYLEQK